MRISSENDLLDAASRNPELAPFAMFEVDISVARDHDTGELLAPSLGGKHTPLWKLTSCGGQEYQSEDDAKKEREKVSHLRRVEAMAARYDRGEPIFEALPTPRVEATEPPDEWVRFWGGDSPTQQMASERV